MFYSPPSTLNSTEAFGTNYGGSLNCGGSSEVVDLITHKSAGLGRVMGFWLILEREVVVVEVTNLFSLELIA